MAGTPKRAASDMISARWTSMKVSGITIRPPFCARACAAMTASSSDVSRTDAAIGSTAKDDAAALNGFRNASAYGATAGLNSIATLVTRGAISLSSSNHLPPSEPSKAWKPVTFPPGRARLATKPLPTGSETVAKTMGMVRVCCRSAAVVGVTDERIRSGCRATSSFANRCLASASLGRHPARVEPDVAAFHPPELLKSLSECGEEPWSFQVVLGIAHQHANPPHMLGLLRACRKRPCGGNSNCLDEIAPSHLPAPRLRTDDNLITSAFCDRRNGG